MNRLEEFISYLEEQYRNRSIYVWGAQGQMKPTVTESWIRKIETSTANADKAVSLFKKQVAAGFGDVLRAFDCSGLGMYFLYNLKKYFSSDLNSNGMKGKCNQITNKSQLRRGDWVFKVYTSGTNKGKAYHIGYIVDDALNIIEAKGRAYGVVKSKFSSEWNWCGRPAIFKTEIESGLTTPSALNPIILTRLLKYNKDRLMNGTDVREVKEWLFTRGYYTSNITQLTNSNFGIDTKNAVIKFQKAVGFKGNDIDGIVGKNTISAMGGKWI